MYLHRQQTHTPKNKQDDIIKKFISYDIFMYNENHTVKSNVFFSETRCHLCISIFSSVEVMEPLFFFLII